MGHSKLVFALVVLAVPYLSVSVTGNSSAAADEANKSDLGIGPFDPGTIMRGKGDCGCAQGFYGTTTTVRGFQRGDVEELPAVIITPTTVSATEEMSGAPATKANDMTLKNVAVNDGGAFLQINAGRLTACVFGAPNASGCGN